MTDKLQSTQTIILKPRKIKNIVLLFTSTFLIVSGINILDKHLWIGLVDIIVFGICLVVFTIHLIPNSAYLKIDEKGIEQRALFKKTFIPWSAVSNFRTKWLVFNKMVVYDVNKGLSVHKPRYKQGGFPETYGMSAKKLADLLNDCKAKTAV